MKKLTLPLFVGLCLAVSGLAQKAQLKKPSSLVAPPVPAEESSKVANQDEADNKRPKTRQRRQTGAKPPPPVIKLTPEEAKANAKNDKEGNQLPVPTNQRAKQGRADQKKGQRGDVKGRTQRTNARKEERADEKAPGLNGRPTRAKDKTKNQRAKKRREPIKKKPRIGQKGIKKGSPLSPKNRRGLRDQAPKGDPLEKNDAAGQGSEEVAEKRKRREEVAGKEETKRLREEAKQRREPIKTKKKSEGDEQERRKLRGKQKSKRAPKPPAREAGKDYHSAKSNTSTSIKVGEADEDRDIKIALDTIDQNIDELTTRFSDTILRSADDPLSLPDTSDDGKLKIKILEIKELLKVLKEDFQTSRFKKVSSDPLINNEIDEGPIDGID